VLICIAHDPGARLRDIAARLGITARLDITERSAHGIITDLTAAGYLVKQKDGRPQPPPDPGAPAAAGGWRREPGLLIRSGDARPVAVTSPCAARRTAPVRAAGLP
jgi:hypothetical protein